MSNLKIQGNASGTGTTTLQSGNTNSNLTLELPIADGTAGQTLVTDGAGVLSFATGGAGDVVGPASSVDSELALFNSTTGKLIKRASLTGLVKSTSGVASAATAGTDYVAPSGALGTPSSGTLTNCTADGTDAVGFRNVPISSKSAAYTTVLADSGKVIFHPSTDANARTFTIDSNANVAYALGTVLTFINMTAAVVTIAITTDTMYLAGTGTTGSRSLAQYGMATAIKMTSTTWIVSGSGLT
jgi:hypothetical protein